MNKAELIDALSARLGDKRAATQALDAVLAEIQTAVTKGDKVAITGFGVFEKQVRKARTGRNPQTGAVVKIKATSVPKFRPASTFKEVVSGAKKLAKAAPLGPLTGSSSKSGPRSTTKKSTAKKSTAKKSTAKKSPAKKSTAKKSPAKKTAKKAARR